MTRIDGDEWREATGAPDWLKVVETKNRSELVEKTLVRYLIDQAREDEADSLSEFTEEFEGYGLPDCTPTQTEAKALLAKLIKAKKVARKTHEDVYYYRWVASVPKEGYQVQGINMDGVE